MTSLYTAPLATPGAVAYHSLMTPTIEVDLYSDTLTKPTAEMRRFMCEAEVGDEQKFEDPTVNLLQEMVAELLGKEAAVFLPSGTMCNEIAIRVHCRPGEEMIAHRTAHPIHFESGGPGAPGRRQRAARSTGRAASSTPPPWRRPSGRPRALLPAEPAALGGADGESGRRQDLAARRIQAVTRRRPAPRPRDPHGRRAAA